MPKNTIRARIINKTPIDFTLISTLPGDYIHKNRWPMPPSPLSPGDQTGFCVMTSLAEGSSVAIVYVGNFSSKEGNILYRCRISVNPDGTANKGYTFCQGIEGGPDKIKFTYDTDPFFKLKITMSIKK